MPQKVGFAMCSQVSELNAKWYTTVVGRVAAIARPVSHKRLATLRENKRKDNNRNNAPSVVTRAATATL